MTWIRLAWANRTRIAELATRLRGTRADPRTWSRKDLLWAAGLLGAAAIITLAASSGFLARFNPTGWNSAQWAQLVVNLSGFGILYTAQRLWWNRQDEVWDEVDQMRSELDALREALYGEEPVEEEPEPEPEGVVVQREFGGRTFTFAA